MPLTEAELEGKLWNAANILRGQIDSSDYKNYIFSMLFLKRLSDRFEEEVENAVLDGVKREVAESRDHVQLRGPDHAERVRGVTLDRAAPDEQIGRAHV